MKVGLVDVDGHHFPNLALMRISSYHKSRGDTVEWCLPIDRYDKVYVSKVFSFSPDIDFVPNAEVVEYSGSGYAISLVDGREVYDKSKDHDLPREIERCFPDYSIYPQYDFAVSMTSRGCPRGCSFCHVAAKEGRCSVKVADVKDFWDGQKEIVILDPNILACRDKRDLLRQYRETDAILDFSQGLDIRLMNGEDIDEINRMRIKRLHFAWDNPKDDLKNKFAFFAKRFRRTTNIGTVYCLTNFNSTMDENLYRIYTLRDIGYDPYVMVYDKEHAPKEIRDLQRWCNAKQIFKSTPNFYDYIKEAKHERPAP